MNWGTDFHSASELAAAMQRLGKDFDVLQLTRGPLEGHFSVVHLSGLSIFSIQTNQLLLLNGERGQDCITFSLETTGNQTEHQRLHANTIESLFNQWIQTRSQRKPLPINSRLNDCYRHHLSQKILQVP